MPARRSFTWAHGVFAAAVLALILASVLARGGRSACAGGCPSQRASVDAVDVLDVDPETGRILVDLDDDASAEDRLEVARRIASAIGPYEWPSDEAALGEMLSDEAELFRLAPPASEVDDVLAELRGDEDVEVVEVEHSWAIPDAELNATRSRRRRSRARPRATTASAPTTPTTGSSGTSTRSGCPRPGRSPAATGSSSP